LIIFIFLVVQLGWRQVQPGIGKNAELSEIPSEALHPMDFIGL